MCIVLVKALDARNFFKSSFTAPIYAIWYFAAN